jgi:cytosine/adenosine deaminase-related metal-dependent hydrolase
MSMLKLPAVRACVAALACLSLPALAAEPSSTVLIHGGYVMTMDPQLGDLDGGDVLVQDGRIVAVGRNLAAQAGSAAQRIDARGKVVLPGFVDTHSHLYVTTMRGQFRNAQGKFFPVSSRLAAAMTADDVGIAMQLGALELLSGGITTTADFFDNVLTPAHGTAGWQALQAAGIRAILYYGGPDKTTRRQIDLEQLRALAALTKAQAVAIRPRCWCIRPAPATWTRCWSMAASSSTTAN